MKNRKYFYGMLLIALFLLAGGAFFYYQKTNFKGRVCLVTLGKTRPEQVSLIKKEIEGFYQFKVSVLPERPLPDDAFYKPRNRYKADGILDYLSGIKPDTSDKIIALVQKDISVETDQQADWGIMGLAWLGGSCCVVSTFRLDRDHPSPEKFKDRLAKTALHEVGHTLGLKHCNRSPYCLMNDAKGSIRTVDRARKELCSYCREKISYTRKEI